MNERTKELAAQIERYRIVTNDLKVDLNIRDARIRDLERELLNERRQVRSMEIGTQTIRKLEILGESEDDNGFDPRQTGTFKCQWGKVR